MKPRQGIPSQCGHVHPVSYGRCLLDFDHAGDHETTAGTWLNIQPPALPLVASAALLSAEQSEDADVVNSITAIVREADQAFERSGGSSRHWVRDCFLPTLNANGFKVVPCEFVKCVHCGEELRKLDGHWLDRETHSTCDTPEGSPDVQHEPIVASAAPQEDDFPKWCPDCEKGIRGGAVCLTCGGSGESAASLFREVAQLKAAAPPVLAAPPQEQMTITTVPHLCPHCDKPTGGTAVMSMAGGHGAIGPEYHALAAPPPREDALALDGLQRIIDEMHALWDDAPSADDTIRLERLENFADELDTELARLRLDAPSSQPQKATEGAP